MPLSRMIWIWGGVFLTLVLTGPNEGAARSAKIARLDAAGGFRGVKLGSRLSALTKRRFVRVRNGWRFYKRSSDNLMLFGARLAEVTYGYKMNAAGTKGVLERIVVVFVSDSKTDEYDDGCGDKNKYGLAWDKVRLRLVRAYGRATSYAESDAKAKKQYASLIRYSGAQSKVKRHVLSFYSHIWKGQKVKLKWVMVERTTHIKGQSWAQMKCTRVLEYSHVPYDGL